ATDPVAATTVAFDDSTQYRPLYDWYEQGFGGSVAAGTGLPASGSTFVSQSNPAVSFQMQTYDQDNVLLLNSIGSSAPLQFVQPGHYQSLNVLASGAYGGANVNVTLDFADGSSTTFPIFVPDWLVTAPAAFNAGGRVLRSSGASPAVYHTAPLLFEFDHTFQPSDEAKILDAVTFTVVAQGSFTNGNIVGIFALSGQSVQIQPQQSYPNPLSVTGNSTIDVRNSLSASMGSLTISSGSLALTGDNGATAQFGSVTISGGDATLMPAANTVLSL